MSLLLETALKASVMIALALAALACLRRQSASLRHWLLAAAFVAAAALPALAVLSPHWTLPKPTREFNVTMDVELIAPPGGATAGPLASRAASGLALADVRQVAMATWIIGVAVNIVVLLAGIGRLAWLRASFHDGTRAMLDEEESVRAQLGLRRRVHIALSSHPALVVAWGVRRPTILMPAAAASWTRDRLRVVTAHEMAHVKRSDWIVQLGAELLRSVYWFNPLFWIACARLRQESEYACDDVVLGLGIERTAYAAHLVDVARSFSAHGRTWLPAPAIARPSTLQRRVRKMLNPHLDRRPVGYWSRLAIAALLFTVAVPVAGGATQSAGVVAGTVRDSSGRVLAEAIVRLSPVNTEDIVQIKTDAQGQFRFAGLSAGEYLLTARSMGFSPLRQNVRVSARETVELPLTLQVGTLQETITVTSGPALPGGSSGSGGYRPPAPPICTPSSTGGQIVPPTKLRDVKPRYDARLADIKGTVILDARIGIDGSVSSVEVFSGVHPDLEDSAIAAVTEWEFSPTYLNCEPVEVRMLVSVTFAGAR